RLRRQVASMLYKDFLILCWLAAFWLISVGLCSLALYLVGRFLWRFAIECSRFGRAAKSEPPAVAGGFWLRHSAFCRSVYPPATAGGSDTSYTQLQFAIVNRSRARRTFASEGDSDAKVASN